MKKLLPILFLSVFFFTNTYAQDKVSDLKTLFKIMNSDQMINSMFNSMVPIMKQQANESIQGDNAKAKFDSYVEFMMQETKELSNTLINKEMVGIYDKIFTHEEIKDLIRFYESPTGKKMLEKTPEMTALLMNSMMTDYMPKFQEKLTKKLEELK